MTVVTCLDHTFRPRIIMLPPGKAFSLRTCRGGEQDIIWYSMMQGFASEFPNACEIESQIQSLLDNSENSGEKYFASELKQICYAIVGADYPSRDHGDGNLKVFVLSLKGDEYKEWTKLSLRDLDGLSAKAIRSVLGQYSNLSCYHD